MFVNKIKIIYKKIYISEIIDFIIALRPTK